MLNVIFIISLLVQAGTSVDYGYLSFLLLNWRNGLKTWVGCPSAHIRNGRSHVESVHWVSVGGSSDCSPAWIGIQLHAPWTWGRTVLVWWCGISSHSHWVLLLVVVKHVGKNILSVLQPLRHLSVVAIKSLVEWHRRSLTLLVDVSDISIFRVKKDLSVILEVNLHNLVAQSEHYSMLSSHPLLHIDTSWWVLKLVGLIQKISLNQLLLFLRIVVLLKIGFEMLKQSYFFLQFLWKVWEIVLWHHILFLVCSNSFSLVVVELWSTWFGHDFSGVIKKDSRRHIR